MLHAAFWADTALAILGVGGATVAAWPVLAGTVLLCSVRHPEGFTGGALTHAFCAIILRYQQRTERVDETILRFLSEAASRSTVIF